ncbi:hypothetical protein [Streptomyces chartreusis]|uniref:hypothetical protein n=1 Tax=Streptomyces chartreusis TaxID=1969 RepID=UPI0033A00BC4
MQQHKRPPGARHAYAHPSRRPRPRLAPPTGTLLSATGARTVSPSASGVPTTGYPNFGANFAD